MATTFTVTSATDDGTGATAGTLSYAIVQANAAAATDPAAQIAINIQLSGASTLTLSGAPPAIFAPTGTGGSLTIDGSGTPGLTIDGQNANRAFFVESGTVAIENMAIANAKATGGAGADGGGGGLGAGGAIFVNAGTTTVANVDFSGDGATGGAGGTAARPGSGSTPAGGGGGGGLGGNGGFGSDGGGGGGGYSGGGGGGGDSNSYGAASAPGGAGGVGPGGTGGNGGGVGQNGQAGTNGGGAGGEGSDNSVNGAASNGGGGGGGGLGGGRGGNSIIPAAPPASGSSSGTGMPTAVGGAGAGGGGGDGLAIGGGGVGSSYDPKNTLPSSSSGSASGSLGGGGGGGSYGGGSPGGDFGGGGGGGSSSGGGGGGFGGGGGGGGVSRAGGNAGTYGAPGGVGGFGGGGGGGLTGTAGGVGGGTGGAAAVGTSNFGGGGGGAAFGGAVFVRAGASFVITTTGTTSSEFSGDGVTGGAAGTGGNASNGAAVGSDLFLQTGTTTTFAPVSGTTLTLDGTIADDSASGVPAGPGYTAGSSAGAGLTIGTGTSGGTVVLGGADTYAGATTIQAGTLRLNSGGSIADSSVVNVAGGATFDATFTSAQSTSVKALSGSGTVLSGKGAVLSLTGGGTTTFAGSITGAGGLTEANAANTGTQILSGSNTYTGTTIIAAGTLQLGAGGTTGSIANTSSIVDNAILAVDHSDVFTLANVISGSGALKQIGSGTLTLSAANTYSGGTTLNAGTLELAAQSAAGSTANGSQTAGGVAFAARGTTLQIDNAALTPTNPPAVPFRVLAATPPLSTTTEGSYAGPVTNFASGETLDLSGLTYAGNGATTATYDTASHTLTVTNGTFTDTLTNFYLGSGLTDGYYTLATSQDANTTAGTNVTVSLNAPSAPVLATGQDTGTSSSDRLTDINKPSFTGTADPNSIITLYDGNGTTAIGTGTSNASGIYTAIVTTALADGAHSVTATVTDTGNDVSARALATSITVDTVPPTITSIADSGPGIDANGNGDLNAGKTVTLTVTTSEPIYVQDGTPTLTLNDGATATYTGGSGTAQQTFSYTVQPGQNTANLAVTQVNANGAAVTDAAGNPLNPNIMGASVPSGTLIVDTTPPVASSPTDTVAQNSGSTPIGIAAPSDNLTAAGNLAIAAGTLPTDGTVTLANGQAVTTGEALTATQLTGLLFTPTPGVSGQGSTFTYTVTDGAGNAMQGTAALNVGAAGAPTITGTHATTDQAEAPVAPFAGVTVSDPSSAAGATETLTIQLTGGGGTLTGVGLTRAADGSYQLAGTAAQVTQQLDALSFIPTAGAAGATTNTTFVLTDRSSAGTSVVDSGTSVADTAASAPPPPPGQPSPDTVSLSPLVSYKDGTFTLTGTASSPAGVRSVEISALVDGVATDLGPATVNPDGTFAFSDAIGAHTQGFITATETDNAGGTAATQAGYSLTGGLPGGKGRQDRYTADGSAVTARDVFKADGSQRVNVLGGGQTFASSFFDTFNNGGAPESTFVFNPGFGRDVVDLFRVDGADHDTLSFKGSDYGNSIATVLNSARDTNAGLLITDPVASSPGGGPGTHDTLLLKGITKQQLAANQGDIAFHA